jgi:hypothetical protein
VTGNFTTSFTVGQTPQTVFAAIADVRAWWSGAIAGRTERVGDVFHDRFEDLHRSTIEITEMAPGRRVAWRIIDSDLSFVADRDEWTGTQVVFDVAPAGTGATLTFTHVGLVPECECYDACDEGWSFYIASLRTLIETGSGQPNAGQPVTGSEEALVA